MSEIATQHESDLELDTESSELYRDGQRLCIFRAQDCKVFVYLIQRRGHFAKPEEILAACGRDVHTQREAVRTSISRIRKRLGEHKHLIETRSSKGYRCAARIELRGPAVGPGPGIPRRLNRYFVDRERLLETLEAGFLSGEPTMRRQVLSGYSGVGKTQLGAYLTLFQAKPLEVLQEPKPPLDHPHSLITIWSLAMEQTRQQFPASADVLHLLAYLGPDDLPRALLCDLATTVTKEFELNQAIAALRRYALVEVTGANGDALSMHRLVQTIVRHYLPQGQQQVWMKAALRVVLGAFAHAKATGQSGQSLARLLPHALAIAEHVKTIPRPTLEHTQHELRLLLDLGEALILFRGYAAPEVEQTYPSVHQLCQQVGLDPKLFDALAGLRRVALTRGQFQTAREYAKGALALAEGLPDTRYLPEAHHALAAVLFFQGKLWEAFVHCARSLKLSDHEAYRLEPSEAPGNDPRVACAAYAGLIRWLQGAPDEALQRCQEAIARADHLERPFSVGGARLWMAALQHFRRDVRAVRQHIEAALRLASEQGFPLWAALARIFEGWVLAQEGHAAEGIAQISEALHAYEAMGAMGARPYYLALLAEAYEKGGQRADALKVLDDALASVWTGEEWWAAEVYRLRGELLDGQGDTAAEVEWCFHQAQG